MGDKIFFKKVVNPFKASVYKGGRKYQVYLKILIEQLGNNPYPNFSISGVHAPLASGNCIGGCGQIVDNYVDDITKVYNKGWNGKLYKDLVKLWRNYHLKEVEIDSELYKFLIAECEKFPETTKEPAWI